jgi:hypothetical protein
MATKRTKKKLNFTKDEGLTPIGYIEPRTPLMNKSPQSLSSSNYNERAIQPVEEKRPVGRPRKYVEGAVEKPGLRDRLKGWGRREAPVRQTAFRGASYGVGATTRNINRAGTAMRQMGGAFSGLPMGSNIIGMGRTVVDTFVLAWNKLSNSMKLLIAIVFFVALLFVPWGIFYYAGWAIAAAVMFLISLIYWGFANAFNAIASGIIAVINGVATIFMGFIVWVVEGIMNLFIGGYYWANGHGLLEHSLIRYDQISTGIPSLLTPVKPEWHNWFNTTIIAKLFEHVPGMQAFVDGLNNFVANTIGKAFNDLAQGPTWVLVGVGLLPMILVIVALAIIYFKNRQHLQPY